MAQQPDPRLQLDVAGDESGSLDFSGRVGDEFFLVVTVGAEHNTLRNALNNLADDLQASIADFTMGQPFHACEDTWPIRHRVFDVLASHDISIDATIVEKALVPPSLVGGPHMPGKRFYRLVWYHHIIHVLPGLLNPACKIQLTIAELGAYSRKQAFQLAVNQATGVAYVPLLIDAMAAAGVGVGTNWPKDAFHRMPALMFDYAEAKDERLLQAADYCAWAIQRKLKGIDDRSYRKLQSRIRSERHLTIAEMGGQHDGASIQMVGPSSWTGLAGDMHTYEVSSRYTVGPADSFQALLGLQEALRRDDLAQAISYLEVIWLPDLSRQAERLRAFLHFIGALTDWTTSHPELALRATTVLTQAAQHMLQRDAYDVLARVLLCTSLYNHACALGHFQRDTEAMPFYSELIEQFGQVQEMPISAMVAKALINRGHAFNRAGNIADATAAYCAVIDRFGDEQDEAFDEPLSKALSCIDGNPLVEARYAETADRRAVAAGLPTSTARAAYYLGRMLEKRREASEAETMYRRAMISGDRWAASRSAERLGWLLRERGNMVDAEVAYQRAIDSGDPAVAAKAWLSVGWLRQERDDDAGAVEAFQQALNSDSPNSAAEAALYLGQVYQKQGDRLRAETAYRQAIDSGHWSIAPRAAAALGWLLLQEGDTVRAEPAFQQAIASGIAEAALAARVGFGRLLHERGDDRSAEVAYRQALDSSDPDAAPMAAYYLGLLLQEQGNVSAAKVMLDRAVESGHQVAALAAATAVDAPVH